MTDLLAPPSTLHELWDAARVVVRGRVTGRETRGVAKAGRASAVPHDSHTFAVIETLKGVEVIGGSSQIEVVTATGTLLNSAGAPVRHGSTERAFDIGTELILFLEPFCDGEGYAVIYGPGGAFYVGSAGRTQRRNTPRQPTEFGSRQDMAVAQFLAVLRSFGTY